MRSLIIGGILLIVGTSIGAGMLALPIANAATGFWQSSLFLLFCWFIMTLGALFVLEVNLYLPAGKNMVSMAAHTLGSPGILIAWLSYLLLLYALLAAYISGGADILGSFLRPQGVLTKDWQASVLFTLSFGAIVYSGIKQVDWCNRILMLGKLGVYLLLVVLISPHIQWRHLQGGEYQHITSTVMILITSFGFAIIVPNLREYFQSDIALLRRVILIGSVIPLVCYFAWDLVIMGTLASKGEQGLQALMEAPKATSSLATILTNTVQNNVISSLFHFFTAICMLTAFLGVSLCLISFLSDGLRINQKGREGILLFLLTFAPPLAVVSYYPEAYIHALRYAGICCVVLLLLLPACMSIAGRKKNRPSYQVPGGAFTQWLVIISSLVLLIDAGYTLGA